MALPWNPERAHQVAQAFLRDTGMREPRARLLRFYLNAIFHLPDSGLTLRIYGPEGSHERAQRMVSVAAFLASRDFPSVRLSPLFGDQPMEVLGAPASVWTWIEEDVEGRKQPRAFGALLRALHQVTDDAAFPTISFDPIEKIANRLERLKSERRLTAANLDVLQAALERGVGLAADVEAVTMGAGVLHGDALLGNAVLSDGRLVLLDFDFVAYGAREWDLAPTYVTATRFRRQDAIWREFLAGYGADGASLRGIEAAAIVKQLSMTVALCLQRGLSPAVDDEIDLRIRCWADWDFQTPWHAPSLLPAP